MPDARNSIDFGQQDNNQKGHPMKFQCYGSSNKFVKVTGRTVKNAVLCNVDAGEENSKRAPIPYVDQRIINSFYFPHPYFLT